MNTIDKFTYRIIFSYLDIDTKLCTRCVCKNLYGFKCRCDNSYNCSPYETMISMAKK